MDDRGDIMRLLGKILAETYRIQRRTPGFAVGVDDAHIYGLQNGFEHVIERELEGIGTITKREFDHVGDVLDLYDSDPAKLAAFKGFYDIEGELKAGGVDRLKAIQILTYLNANGQFDALIRKMDSDHSPSECRKFDLKGI